MSEDRDEQRKEWGSRERGEDGEGGRGGRSICEEEREQTEGEEERVREGEEAERMDGERRWRRQIRG